MILTRDIITSSHLSPELKDRIGLDLEMANSFYRDTSVICMIGLGRYYPDRQECRTTIGSITRRSDEAALVQWLLDQLDAFMEEFDQPKLLSFSGLDNDLRWLNDRLETFGMHNGDKPAWERIQHLDLKQEFYSRTQNDKISLKKLEEIFGIERESTISSKKVSYMLTDIVKNEKSDDAIPDKLYEYLHEDVHNLLLIHDRWENTALDAFNLADLEYNQLLVSLIKTTKKFLSSEKVKNGFKKQLGPVKEYLAALNSGQDQILKEKSFKNYQPPAFPDVHIRHSEFDRIRKKHGFFSSLEAVDPVSGDYRFQERMFKPKGALCVVRQDKKLLMVRRSSTVKRIPGHWGLPGGEVEEGESPEECAVRELFEEVNLVGEAVRVLGTSPSYTGAYELTWVEIEVESPEELKPNPREIGAVRWVEPTEVLSLDPIIPGTLENFRKMLGREWGSKGK